MNKDGFNDRKRPRFYRDPSAEEIASNGQVAADVHARVRARIIGSRVTSSIVAVGAGTTITAMEYLTTGEASNWLPNFCVPAIFNGIAQIKIERQLHSIEGELDELITRSDD